MNIISPSSAAKNHYDLIFVGSGFGSSFFLAEALHRVNGKILVLEWGSKHSMAWQIKHRKNSDIDPKSTFTNKTQKPWNYTIAFGGGTMSWYGHTPRLHPSDFKTKTKYGVANDWPVTYDELEPFYCEAEQLIGIAGDPGADPTEPTRSHPYPGKLNSLAKTAKMISDSATGLGYNPFRLPLAINYESRNGQEACIACPTCDTFACAIG